MSFSNSKSIVFDDEAVAVRQLRHVQAVYPGDRRHDLLGVDRKFVAIPESGVEPERAEKPRMIRQPLISRIGAGNQLGSARA